MIKFLGTVFAIVPSVAIAFVTGWTDLFRNSTMVRPDISTAAVNTAAGLSVLFSIVAVLLCRQWAARRLAKWAISSLIVSVILALASAGMRHFLDYPRSLWEQEITRSLWDACGVVFIIAAIVAVTFATLFGLKTWAKADATI